MNNDLISRQEVLNFIQGIKDEIIENKCFGDNTRTINMGDLNDILIFIRYTQTAYDIDKFANRLKEKISNNVMIQTFGLRGKDIFYLIDETLNELKGGVNND